MKTLLKKFVPVIDLFLSPITLLSTFLLLRIRKLGVHNMKISKKIFFKVGLFPIRDHYYEPLFNPKYLRYSLRKDRSLPGIDFNIDEQLKILKKFNFNNELIEFPLEKKIDFEYYYHNQFFLSGDAEYFYNIIRLYKPKRIIEIGSGYSTLIAIKAIATNKIEQNNYNCEHICIEPFEMNWLERMNLKVIRESVETINKTYFSQLGENDILFIDSSHIIRPQGDVLCECLEILPILKTGVLVHFHDIFTPKDYLDEWIIGDIRFWNEQYLLEAFLSFNYEYKIIGALNYLKNYYFSELSDKCPILKKEPNREPGSFWIRKK